MPPSSLRGCWQNSVPRRLLNRGPQFLTGCWPESALSSLPCGPFQHCGLLHQSLQEKASQQEIETASKTEVTVFFNLIMEVTSRHFFCILFTRIKSLGPAHTEEGTVQGCEHQEVGIIGNQFRSFLPQDVFTTPSNI